MMNIWFEDNKKMWNERVPVHYSSDFYGMETFLAGRNSLTEIEQSELGQVNGKSILHLQCHFGQDSLSLARQGARVTGVDFSTKAVEKARYLNDMLQLDARFILSDVYQLPKHIDQKFDIVFTSFGVIGWLPDLKIWASVIKRFLKPEGVFYMAEFHPFLWLLDEKNNFSFRYPYFNKHVITELSEGTYTDGSQKLKHVNHSWNHPLSDVIQALLDAKMNLVFMHEFDYSPFKIFAEMEKIEDRKYRLPRFGYRYPYVYSLKFINPEINKK